MPKVKVSYYAVRKGRTPGIYPLWEECEAQVKGFHGAIYKKLATEREAHAFIAGELPSKLSPSSGLSHSTVPPAVSLEEDEHGCDVVYCDGACKGNGKVGSVAGLGVWWGWHDSRNIAERCSGEQTNNRAELMAIVRVLETTPFSQRPLIIKTDSQYCIQCFESWLPKWNANGFRTGNGEPVKNAALIRYLAALLHARERSGPKVRFKHVRGHVGIEGNECADRLANDGALKPEISERDWAQLTRDLEQSTRPRIVGRIAEQVKSSTDAPRPTTSISASSSGTRLQQPSATPSPSREPEQVLDKAELDAYASCLLDNDEFLESDF